jgi:hypothetical protein
MIQHPAILSLLASSAISVVMLLFAGWKGVQILSKWDLESGSELQLGLERSTYLISTILSFILVFQAISIFLFIYTADYLHNLFVGAMCAAGSLNANRFGYPTLLLKIATCVLAGVWLIINHVDTRGYDYPLIRSKYAFLLALTPLVAAESVLQFMYFGRLKGQVITSCCGSLFSSATVGVASELSALPRVPMESALGAGIMITCLCGLIFRTSGKGGYLFAGASSMTFVIALASLVSFVSLYLYELPTHHCPFCMLHREYGYVGYPLFVAAFGAGVSGLGVGVLMPARKLPSLAGVAPEFQRTLAAVSMTLHLMFGLIVLWLVSNSALKF